MSDVSYNVHGTFLHVTELCLLYMLIVFDLVLFFFPFSLSQQQQVSGYVTDAQSSFCLPLPAPAPSLGP